MYAYDTLIDAVAVIDRLDMGAVFRIDPHGEVEPLDTHPHGDVPHAPDRVEHDDEDDVLIDGGSSEWTALTGLTRQDSYRGAVLHPSETMSPGIVEAMREMGEGHVWTIVPVEAPVRTHGPDDHGPGCDVPFGACDDEYDPCVTRAVVAGCPDPVGRANGCSGGPGCDAWQGCTCETTDGAPAGWVVLYADDPTRRMHYHQAEDAYEDWLDEVYEPVSVCGYEYDAGRLLRLADPVAFRCGVADWTSSEGIEIV